MSKKNDIYDETEELQDEELFDQAASDGLSSQDELEEDDNEVEEDDAEEDGSKKKLSDMLSDSDINAASLKELLRNMEFNGEWFRRNLKFIAIVTICLLIFVTNRYQAQQEMIEEADLKQELDDEKYRWLTRFSELTTASRQSQIEERLKQIGDSSLKLSNEAPIIIKTNK